MDSFDMLELAMFVEEAFGIAIRSGAEARIAFSSIGSLAEFITVRSQIGRGQLLRAEVRPSIRMARRPAAPFARKSIA